jgi:hypothetical protein
MKIEMSDETAKDHEYLHRAIELARQAEKMGNLPSARSLLLRIK